MPPLSGGSLRKIKEHAVDKRQDGQCGGLRCPDSAHPTSYISPAHLTVALFLSIYISTHLDTPLVVGGGVWSECVVLVQGDHWRCVHLFPCRSMTHTSPPPPPPPLFSVYILHCVHMSSHQTRHTGGKSGVIITYRFYPTHTHTVAATHCRVWGTCLTYYSRRKLR